MIVSMIERYDRIYLLNKGELVFFMILFMFLVVGFVFVFGLFFLVVFVEV